jgi:hypothetical protein
MIKKRSIDKIASDLSVLPFDTYYINVCDNAVLIEKKARGINLFEYPLNIRDTKRIKEDLFNQMNRITIALPNGALEEYYEFEAFLDNRTITMQYRYGMWASKTITK